MPVVTLLDYQRSRTFRPDKPGLRGRPASVRAAGGDQDHLVAAIRNDVKRSG
jgi:hypothetical protein